jgi:DNA-binding IclR family transcriptional regulator
MAKTSSKNSTGPGGPAGIPALSRGLAALRAIAAAGAGGAGFGELRRALDDLPAPTLSRLLKALVASGHAVKTEAGRYAAGPELSALGRELSGGGSLEDVARAALAEFTRRTGESAAFARFYGDRLVLVEKSEIADGYKLASAGTVFHPAEDEGPAIAVASLLSGAAFDKFVRAHGSRVASMTEFRAAAARCREAGYRAEPMPNRPVKNGPRRVCCAVAGPDGAPVGELHAVCPGERFPERKQLIVESLLAAAKEIAERIGRRETSVGKG